MPQNLAGFAQTYLAKPHGFRRLSFFTPAALTAKVIVPAGGSYFGKTGKNRVKIAAMGILGNGDCRLRGHQRKPFSLHANGMIAGGTFGAFYGAL